MQLSCIESSSLLLSLIFCKNEIFWLWQPLIWGSKNSKRKRETQKNEEISRWKAQAHINKQKLNWYISRIEMASTLKNLDHLLFGENLILIYIFFLRKKNSKKLQKTQEMWFFFSATTSTRFPIHFFRNKIVFFFITLQETFLRKWFCNNKILKK